MSLLDLVQGDKGILVGGEKLLDVSYEGMCSGCGFLMETKQGIWRRNRRFGNDTGGSDREQHFVTHDRRAYLGSGDVSNRLQSPNMWKEKQTFTFVPSLVKLQRILFQLTSVPRFTVSAGFLQLDRRRWGIMITKFFSLYFPPFLPSLSVI